MHLGARAGTFNRLDKLIFVEDWFLFPAVNLSTFYSTACSASSSTSTAKGSGYGFADKVNPYNLLLWHRSLSDDISNWSVMFHIVHSLLWNISLLGIADWISWLATLNKLIASNLFFYFYMCPALPLFNFFLLIFNRF